jgi:rare lipoprotein A
MRAGIPTGGHAIRRSLAGPAALLLLAASLSTPSSAQVSEEFALAFAPYAQPPAEAAPDPEPDGEVLGTGMASWYGSAFAGRRTASGERFDPGELTAAHPSLPFGSLVKVTLLDTGNSVVVRINDRGPFAGGRVIDLSQAAAREIGLIGPGHGRVSLALLP